MTSGKKDNWQKSKQVKSGNWQKGSLVKVTCGTQENWQKRQLVKVIIGKVTILRMDNI